MSYDNSNTVHRQEPSGEHDVGEDHGAQSASVVASGAEAAWDAYYEEAAARYGAEVPANAYQSHESWPHFLQVALLCASRGWNPDDYVRKAVDFAGRYGRLFPADLHTRKYVNAYAARMESEYPDADPVKRSKGEYKRCVELLIQREMDGGGNDEKPLLMSPATSFPAWFRVVYPERLDIDILNTWGDTAKRELSSTPGLIQLVSGMFPEKWERLKKALWLYENEGGVR